MPSFSSYDFGYSWYVVYGHLIPLALAIGVGGLAVWRGWRVVSVLAGALAVWSIFGLVVTLTVFGLNRPSTLPTDRFLSSGSGRVLDAGAGSCRAAVSVLLARPKATVTGLDIYSGYWGHRRQYAGALHGQRTRGWRRRARRRADRRRGRHALRRRRIRRRDQLVRDRSPRPRRHVKALAEVGRVLKPGGELLLLIINASDWLVRLASPHVLGHHPRQDPERWRRLLADAGTREGIRVKG